MSGHIENIKRLLDEKLLLYNGEAFILDDPIQVVHQYSKKPDQELAAWFTATFAWGNRQTVIKKSKSLLAMMDNRPYDFIRNHQPIDLKPLLSFVHRTFNATDLLFFINRFKVWYQQNDSLEGLFAIPPHAPNVKEGLINFYNWVFEGEYPERSRKHVSTPASGSACKRLNMFLRWMVRKDDWGVDLGLWKSIQPAQLVIPLDVHVANVAQRLGLITTTKVNWYTAEALTNYLKQLDAEDPIKYDLALYTMGKIERLKYKH